MKIYFKNQQGLSLIWVIIMLVVVGILSAALLTAGTFNIRFGFDETETSKAFYAAEAGVEYTTNALLYLGSEELNKLLDIEDEYIKIENDNGDFIITQSNEGWVGLSGTSEFRIKLDNTLDDEVVFISEGRTNNQTTQEIEFSFSKSSIYDIALLLRRLEEDDEKSDYLDFKGQPKEFSEDNVELVDIDDFWAFLHEEKYIEYSFESAKVTDYLDFDTEDESHIASGVIDEDLFFTPDKVALGETIEWAPDLDFDEGDVVSNNDEYYIAIEDHTSSDENEPGVGANWEEFWDEIDTDEVDDYDMRNVDITNSVVIVNGDLSLLGGVELKNSLVLVRNTVTFGGRTELDKSLIIAFNSEEKEDAVTITPGTPSIKLIDLVTSDIYENWSGIEEIIDTIDNGNLEDLDFVRWRQL